MAHDDQNKIWAEQPKSVALKYDAYDQRRGKLLINYIEKNPVNSLFEVGCNAGRTLSYLNKHMPDLKLGGLEINKIAYDMAREKIPTAELYNGDLYEMDITQQYDIVYTGGVLMHIPPDEIRMVMKKCLDKAVKYVIHIEPRGANVITNGPKEFKPKKIRNLLRCLHDVPGLYKELGYECVVNDDKKKRESFMVIKK